MTKRTDELDLTAIDELIEAYGPEQLVSYEGEIWGGVQFKITLSELRESLVDLGYDSDGLETRSGYDPGDAVLVDAGMNPVLVLEGKITGYEEHIGKSLYNRTGRNVGVITGVEEYKGMTCFVVDHGPEPHPGKHWQVSRLNATRIDRITTDAEKAAKWHRSHHEDN